MPYIVLDIETVNDAELWTPAKANPRSKKPPEEQMPPLYAVKPIVIGYCMFDDNFNYAGMGAEANDNEPQLIASFNEWLRRFDATLVTFNGRTFDLPVLALRAMRHGLSQDFNTVDHRKRFSEGRHIDLHDVLTEYGYLGKTGYNLDALCQMIGLAPKTEHGSDVGKLYAEGKIDVIKAHCVQDIARSAFLLFRYLLMRGRISIELYRAAAKGLFDKCVEFNLASVTFGTDQKRLLLPLEG